MLSKSLATALRDEIASLTHAARRALHQRLERTLQKSAELGEAAPPESYIEARAMSAESIHLDSQMQTPDAALAEYVLFKGNSGDLANYGDKRMLPEEVSRTNKKLVTVEEFAAAHARIDGAYAQLRGRMLRAESGALTPDETRLLGKLAQASIGSRHEYALAALDVLQHRNRLYAAGYNTAAMDQRLSQSPAMNPLKQEFDAEDSRRAIEIKARALFAERKVASPSLNMRFSM